MTAAGAQMMNWFAVACELHRDWRNDIEGLGNKLTLAIIDETLGNPLDPELLGHLSSGIEEKWKGEFVLPDKRLYFARFFIRDRQQF